ncbi:MAG: urate hydroxylase PuuD [Hyphomicrobiales bacterium]|nr:urate hydroxylase PuuD [Hyphomicrobiales bacterium]MDE2114326.1 urate hydroxylase PuuD [Hyphomicrobiales bacterium]
MQAYVMDFGSMLLRWLHVTTAIAWIGSSFFFMHLDASIRQIGDIPAGQGGEAWQVHGGGFYQMRKYFVAPGSLPEEITWHKWQSYWTWISGFFLLVWVYYAQASLFLIDPNVLALEPLQAAAIGIAALALGWLVYDQLCKSPLGKNDNLLALVGFGFVVLMSYFFTRVFSGRGAMIHTGALMATMMTANVFMVIMPNQRKTIAALERGEKPEPKYAKQAKQRSSHNNYITLPVLFMMLSSHYPVFWSNAAVIPAIVCLVIIAGAVIRHFYNVRHAHHGKSPWWAWGVAALAMWTAFYVAMTASPGGRLQLGLAPRVIPNAIVAKAQLPPQNVVDIITGRCAMCHSSDPAWEGIQIAPKGVLLDTPERIAAHAAQIEMQAVLTHAMPPNNITEIEPQDRQQLAVWLKHATHVE